MEFIHGMDRSHTSDLMNDMVDHLSEEGFRDCVESMFRRICEKEGDVEKAICGIIEKVLFDIESSYYDDDETEPSIEDIAGLIRERFEFVKAMFAADLKDDAVDFCRRIADGLNRVSADPAYAEAKEILSSQRDELLVFIENDECEKWFGQK